MDEEQFYSGEPTSFRGPSYWNEGPLTADGRRFYEEQFHGEYMEGKAYVLESYAWIQYLRYVKVFNEIRVVMEEKNIGLVRVIAFKTFSRGVHYL